MIRILKKNVADKIAAGEVVDRPVSIIKELVENSIDADADAITVEIRNGGKSYIRVTDNGCGIESGEAELAFTRHATSKISEAEDLNAVSTLGFRGEALASICAVARVELITKTADTKTGRKVLIEGSEVKENSATGCPDGTTVTVRDLFYNVPARRKFLSSDNAETRRIIDMVSKIALAYGDVRITMINGGKTVFSTRGNGNILNNIVNIYGNEAGNDLLPVEGSREGFIIKGFVSSPASSAPSRSRQIFCVNGRIVSSKVLEKALDEAYREKLFSGRYPIAFLFLVLPPEKLDVNVHPTKKEIRFDDDFEVEDFVREQIKRALDTKEAIPRLARERVHTAPPRNENPVPKTADGKERSAAEEQVDIKSLLSVLREKTDNDARVARVEDGGVRSYHAPDAERLDFNALDYIGVVFDTYILAHDSDNFYLIDQHAAHERVFYEKLLEQYRSGHPVSQTLLTPVAVDIPSNAAAIEDSWAPDIAGMGYTLEDFGHNRYMMREIPAFMELCEAEDFLSDFFLSLEDRPDLTDRKTVEKIIMRSCKRAVKGGDALSDDEITALIKDLSACDNPFSCPHGRPTFIRMTRYDIEKMFKRA